MASGLFVARTTELYLTDGGRFGFVVPHAVLSRRQYAGFRTGRWSSASDNVNVALEPPWELHRVKPSFFPVPGSVVFGQRTTATGRPPDGSSLVWSGHLSHRNAAFPEAQRLLRRTTTNPNRAVGNISPYASRFTQGATLVPRFLMAVQPEAGGPLGTGAGRRAVRSHRSANEKKPWKTLPDLVGAVEQQFVLPMYVGDTVLPFRTRKPQLAVIPWDGKRLLDGADNRLDLYPGLADWWRRAEQIWEQHRTSRQLSLRSRIDYQRTLSGQFPAGSHRVVYSASGMYLAAARVSDTTAVMEHKLYWAAAADINEARYLTAILNSEALLELVRPLQGRGEHNPRDFDKYVFQLPIPLYDPDVPSHRALAELAERAEQVAAAVDLATGVSFQALRRRIRQQLATNGVAGDIDSNVRDLLTS